MSGSTGGLASLGTAASELRELADSPNGSGFSTAGSYELSGIESQLAALGLNGGSGLTAEQRQEILKADADLMSALADGVGGHADPQKLRDVADRLDKLSGGDSSGGEVNQKLASELLDEAEKTQDPQKKADYIKAAIDALGGGGGQDAPGGNASAPGGGDSPPGGAPPPSDSGRSDPAPLSGDKLKPWLDAQGGTVGEKDGGFGVSDGASDVQKVQGEINRGQSLTFTAPPDAKENGGADVTLGKLFSRGPDGDHTEKAEVVARDADGKVVGTYEVDGTKDGDATVHIDKPFATLEFKPKDDGAGGSTDNSDFTVKSIDVKPASSSGNGGAQGGDTELLRLLGKLTDLIKTEIPDPVMQNQMLDRVEQMVRNVQTSNGAGADPAAGAG